VNNASPVLQDVLAVWAFGCVFLFAVFLVVSQFYRLRAARHRAPDAPYRMMVDINPSNAGWFSDQLDEVGQEYQKKSFRYFAIAGVFVLLLMPVMIFLQIAQH
jgi:hypothetical protein